jgi:hypothetical protein
MKYQMIQPSLNSAIELLTVLYCAASTWLAKPNALAASVYLDKNSSRTFQGVSYCQHSLIGNLSPPPFKVNDRRKAEPRTFGQGRLVHF